MSCFSDNQRGGHHVHWEYMTSLHRFLDFFPLGRGVVRQAEADRHDHERCCAIIGATEVIPIVTEFLLPPRRDHSGQHLRKLLIGPFQSKAMFKNLKPSMA